MTNGSIEIRCLSEESDFLALESEWQRVAERCSSISVFQTHEWQRTWWKHYGSGSIHTLVAYAGSHAVAILPLYRSEQRLPLVRSLQVLRQIGVGGDTSPDYLGQIAMDEYAREAADAFTSYLLDHRTDWDVLELTDLPGSSPLREALLSLQLPGGCVSIPEEPTRIRFCELPGTWELYLQSIGSHARYSVRSVRKKFVAVPENRLFQWTDPARLDYAVDELIRLHTLRWEGRTEHYSFSSDQYNAFHRELMHEFLRAGWLRLYCMEMAGRMIGMFYGYSFRGTLYHFQGGFDPQYEKVRAGQCLMAFAIESAIEEGCSCLDMLRGEYEYKKRWAPLVRETYSYRIIRSTLPARVSRVMRRLVHPMMHRANRVIRRMA
ncbi:MAG TPA: GNAT family N-acetyltransferase [Steroidobacteraceae bacterium]|nr:GNAT family N-acetyltransferase [Steroidobacteraceae bacterium]